MRAVTGHSAMVGHESITAAGALVDARSPAWGVSALACLLGHLHGLLNGAALARADTAYSPCWTSWVYSCHVAGSEID
jgi:hypothetical protein